jgi:hypothetical protein
LNIVKKWGSKLGVDVVFFELVEKFMCFSPLFADFYVFLATFSGIWRFLPATTIMLTK